MASSKERHDCGAMAADTVEQHYKNVSMDRVGPTRWDLHAGATIANSNNPICISVARHALLQVCSARSGVLGNACGDESSAAAEPADNWPLLGKTPCGEAIIHHHLYGERQSTHNP